MKNGLSRRQFIHLSSAMAAGFGSQLILSSCSNDNSAKRVESFDKIPLPQDEQGRWWLSDNYAPIDIEREELNLKITGELPRELNGLYVRTGSNMADTAHWFMGHGMMHGIRLQEGNALWYRNRYVNTAIRDSDGENFSPFDLSFNFSNVAMIHHGNKLLSMGEIGLPYEIATADLSTTGVYNFDGRLDGSMTAHPKVDPVSGELLFFGYNFFPPFLTFHQANANGELTRSVPITLPEGVMMHDFAITRNHVLFYDLPVIFSLDSAIAGSDFPFAWSDSHVPRIGVMPRSGGDGDIKWFEVSPCFIFHTLNAFDDPDNPQQVVLDASRIEGPFWEESAQDFSKPSYLHRWRFDLENMTVAEAQLTDIPMDFGQLNRSLTGQNYRYGYGVDYSERTTTFAASKPVGYLCHDHETGETRRHTLAKGMQGDEAVFAAAPDGDEQDGWLLSYVFNATRNQTDLLVIDARNFSGEAVATIELPFRVPFGFHGIWIAD